MGGSTRGGFTVCHIIPYHAMPRLKSKQVTWSAIEIFVSPTAAMLDPNFAQDLQVLEIRLISCRCQSHMFPIISIEGVLSLAPPRDFLPNPIPSNPLVFLIKDFGVFLHHLSPSANLVVPGFAD